jgi:phosphopantothenoylcysteine decarboxylase/phosphopantothenate--cysteine ligase
VRVLVTAGPTREPLDAVRFFSNAATGLLGIEVARAAVAAGHEAVLVLGPTHLEAPAAPGLEVLRVTTGLEMLEAAAAAWSRCDALVATAAVSDWRPARPSPGKPEKRPGTLTVEMVPNPDILATLSATKGRRVCVGFALQVEDAERRAREKLVRKALDLVVLDSPAELGATHGTFRLIPREGPARDLVGVSKADLARELVAWLAAGA